MTKTWAVGLIVLCTLFTSSAQMLYKFGADKLQFDFFSIITNYYLIGGLVLYAIGAVLMMISFKGGELSILYPIFSTSYIWVSLIAVYFLGEMMNAYKWIGIIVIIIGISLIGFRGNKNSSLEYTEAV